MELCHLEQLAQGLYLNLQATAFEPIHARITIITDLALWQGFDQGLSNTGQLLCVGLSLCSNSTSVQLVC